MSRRQRKPSKATGNRKNHGRLRNHVIPEAHMRRFAEENLVYTFDFVRAQKCRSYNQTRQNPTKATVFKGFYTDKYEVKLSEQFEQGVREIMDKIIGDQLLLPDERIRLSRYIHAYRVRGPWMLRLMQNRYETDMRDAIQELSGQLSFVQKSLYDIDRPIDENFSEEMRGVLANIESELNDAETVQSSSRSFFSEGSLLTIEPMHAVRQLASLPWRVFVSADQPFLLGDRFFEVNGQDQPIFEMYCPISSTHCLFISRYAPRPEHRIEEIEYMPVDERTTRAINVRTVAVSERYVISGQDLSWVSSARKTPAKKHLDLRVPNMRTEQLVGGYIFSRCPQCWWALTPGTIVERQLASVEDDTAMVNTFTQITCTNTQCGFATTFQNRSDRTEYQFGADAIEIRRRLRPSDRDIPPIEEVEAKDLILTSGKPPSDVGEDRD